VSPIRPRRHLISVISEADGEVYGKYADELIRFATGVVGPDDGPDAVSTAVLRTFTSPAWPPPSPIRPDRSRKPAGTPTLK